MEHRTDSASAMSTLPDGGVDDDAIMEDASLGYARMDDAGIDSDEGLHEDGALPPRKRLKNASGRACYARAPPPVTIGIDVAHTVPGASRKRRRWDLEVPTEEVEHAAGVSLPFVRANTTTPNTNAHKVLKEFSRQAWNCTPAFDYGMVEGVDPSQSRWCVARIGAIKFPKAYGVTKAIARNSASAKVLTKIGYWT